MPLEALIDMFAPLPKHRGSNGAVVAGAVLVVATAIVYATQPKPLVGAMAERQARPAAAAPVAVVEPVRPTTGPLKAIGVTTFDESVTSHVMAPVRGFVTKLNIREGRRVRAGETLAVLHGYDVLAAELDLVTQVQQFTTQELLSNARRRLMRFGMPRPLIERVERTGIGTPTLPMIAPRNGTVVAMTAVPGLFAEPGELFAITDPRRIWVIADVPEADAARCGVGAPAKLRVEGVTKPIAAKVAYMYRLVDDGMRKVRFELTVPAPIKPGARVELTFE